MPTDSFIVSHSLPLRGADINKLTAILSNMQGIQAICAEERGRQVTLTYNLLLVGLSDIENAFDVAGAKEPLGLIKKIHRSWTKFTEQNARDSVLAPIRDCCNRPPAGG
ncbi:MAG: hypothetical protein OEL53_07200 [Rhodospirillales bacterium]|nr:hypothetical protein [Rhodospirillales bacterium]